DGDEFDTGHLGSRIQVEVPRRTAVDGTVKPADAGVEVAADGKADVVVQKQDRPDRKRGVQDAVAPGLAAVAGAVDPTPNFRGDGAAGYPAVVRIRECHAAPVEDGIDTVLALPALAVVRTMAEVDPGH